MPPEQWASRDAHCSGGISFKSVPRQELIRRHDRDLQMVVGVELTPSCMDWAGGKKLIKRRYSVSSSGNYHNSVVLFAHYV